MQELLTRTGTQAEPDILGNVSPSVQELESQISHLEKEATELKEAVEQQKGKNNVSRVASWVRRVGQGSMRLGKVLMKPPEDPAVKPSPYYQGRGQLG